MKPFLVLTFTLLFSPVGKGATSVSIDWFNEAPVGTKLRDIFGIPLTSGTEASGDGAVLQLGYYASATQSSPFSGVWIPLTGPGTYFVTTIGDTFRPVDGKFGISTAFKSDYANVPPPGTPLSIRFYDTTSLATANYFNAVSNTDGSWNWITSDPEAKMSLAIKEISATQVWQDGAASAFRTTIAVPEPSVALLAVSSALLAFRRRRN